MEVKIILGNNKIQTCKYGEFDIHADATELNGGEGKYPEPFDYFVASVALCASHYAREFCLARKISTEGFCLKTSTRKSDDAKIVFVTSIKLPKDFPAKYRKAILSTVNKCSVKKAICAGPVFESCLI